MIRSVGCSLLFLIISLFSELAGQAAFPEEPVDPPFKTSANIPYDANIIIGKHFKSLDIYAPPSGKNHPVVIWVHGGAWKIGDKRGVDSKPSAFTQRGYLLVSINYRLHPQASYDQQAEDIAQAIHWIHAHATEYGGDPDELFLMGHSAGAHLVALVSTNPVYLKQQSLSLKSIKGTILLDGAGYDIAEHMTTTGPTARKMYSAVFSDDPQIWKAASPVTYVRKNQSIPPFLILHVARRADSRKQSEAFARILQENKIKAEVIAAPGKTHLTINREIGLPDDLPTQKIFGFLNQHK
ncbi:alpha/beta hydrolase [Gimesia algae]|uniref:Carboxylesterase n=1 Tax=Gimesia algae TaxID=2527971 RepID=A0A517VDY0_9PLAN|nr:alpha/beta hydrolase [Gimesia algae]QDT91218.1 Carboxylesterase [Gimesia algae]